MSATMDVRARVKRRMQELPDRAGAWGIFIGGMLMLAVCSVLVSTPGNLVTDWRGLRELAIAFGDPGVIIWMVFASVVPLVGVLYDAPRLRRFGTFLHSGTWFTIAYISVFNGLNLPAVIICLIGISCMINADRRHFRRKAERTAGDEC